VAKFPTVQADRNSVSAKYCLYYITHCALSSLFRCACGRWALFLIITGSETLHRCLRQDRQSLTGKSQSLNKTETSSINRWDAQNLTISRSGF